MENNELIQSINDDMSVNLPEAVSYDELHHLLAIHINDLIKNDFEKLVSSLYRIDVNEQKLKLLLQQYLRLMIFRQSVQFVRFTKSVCAFPKTFL